MADTQNINAVTALQSIDANDSILVSDGNTSLAKIDYNKLAKSIIEQYTGSTLAGSGQSIQSAFNTLNSKLMVNNAALASGTDFNNLQTSGIYNYPASSTNAPSAGSGSVIVMSNNTGTQCTQIATPANTADTYIRYRYTSVWGEWKIIPKRTEIDALNSNMTWKDAGSATQLNEEVVFPATAKELYIELAIQNSSGYVYSFYIVLTASRYYFNGYYTSSTDNGSCAINITSNHSVKAVTVNYKGDAQTAINMVVKYR